MRIADRQWLLDRRLRGRGPGGTPAARLLAARGPAGTPGGRAPRLRVLPEAFGALFDGTNSGTLLVTAGEDIDLHEPV